MAGWRRELLSTCCHDAGHYGDESERTPEPSHCGSGSAWCMDLWRSGTNTISHPETEGVRPSWRYKCAGYQGLYGVLAPEQRHG